MNNTPNYGFDRTIDLCAIGAIDNNLKKVEDKAEANATALARHAERITRNEERIECLSKQKCSGYSKCEINELLDNKVDKQDGYSLIAQDRLEQICTNEDTLSGLQEKTNYLEAELSKKATAGTLPKYALELAEDITPYLETAPYYYKDPFGTVTVCAQLSCAEPIEFGTLLAQLPKGFRPEQTMEYPAIRHSSRNDVNAAFVGVGSSGRITANGGVVCKHIAFNISFLSAE